MKNEEILSKLNVEKTKEIDKELGCIHLFHPIDSVYELDYENFLKLPESKFIHDFLGDFGVMSSLLLAVNNFEIDYGSHAATLCSREGFLLKSAL